MSDLTAVSRPFWGRWPIVGAPRPLVSVIELSGVVGGAVPGRRGLSYARLRGVIEAAFRPKKLAAVALSVNSPGGSPVQARLICSAIRRAAAKKKTKVFSFTEDVGASGGYLLALAGDEIYADASSIVGSIGAIAAGFGFQEAIARLGVERRVHVAGRHKAQLDPFRPEDPADAARLQAALDDLHAQFIALVKERRGARLSADADIFDGEFWTAAGALSRGLIDGVAQLGEFLQEKFGEDVRVRRCAERPSLLRHVFGGGAVALDVEAALSALEERALWARYGL
jgi:serine protease SohB